MALVLVTGPTIAAGQSLSSIADMSAGLPVRINMPPAWDGAVMTFQTSSDGVTFHDLFDVTGREVSVNIVPNTAVRLDTNFASAPVYLKFRSGTRAKPVNQSAARVFSIAQVK